MRWHWYTQCMNATQSMAQTTAPTTARGAAALALAALTWLAGAGAAAAAAAAAPSSAAWQDVGALVRLAHEHVARSLPESGGRLVVTVVPPDERLRLPACATPLAETPEGQRLWGWTQVRVRCGVEGGWAVGLRVRVQVFAPALLARRAVPPGQVLEADDLQIAEIDLTANPRAPLRDAALAVGRVVRIGLGAGQPVAAENLRLPLVVRRGAPVEVTATVGQVSATSAGTAEQDGAVGDLVRVKMPGGRMVQAKVTGEGRVAVETR